MAANSEILNQHKSP